MKHELLMGLDLGTSAIKGMLMSIDGKVTATGKAAMIFEKSGSKVEFDADKYYFLVASVIRELVEKAGDANLIRSVSMASASGNTLLLDNGMKPLTPAISWTDTRIKDETDIVYKGLDMHRIHELVGWPFLPAFPLAHLAWFKLHRPNLYTACAKVCMSTEYVNYRLTGAWGIDHSTATPFYLQDQKAGIWNRQLLDILGLDEAKLPPLMRTGTVLGGLTAEAAADTGLKAGTPVVLGAFDHPCAARGVGVLEPGKAMLSCGTSWVGFFPVENRAAAIENRMLTDPFLQPSGPWGAMFSIMSVGQDIDWFIENYISNGKDRYELFNRLAADAQKGCGGLKIDLTSRNTDTFEQKEKNSITSYSEENISRAIMEAAAYLLKDKLKELESCGIEVKEAVMVGGPSESPVWPQIIADITGIDIVSGYGAYSGAIGAAIIAGVGAGIYKDEYTARALHKYSNNI